MQKLYHIKANDIFHNLSILPQLVFEVTDACNLRCKYCGYGNIYEGYDKRENLNFPLYRAKTIIDFLHSLWKNKYCIGVTQVMSIGFYGGEPLLNITLIKDIIQFKFRK